MEKRVKVRALNRFNVAPERVFDTLLDASKAKSFMFSTVTGKMIKAEIDPKVGGGFTFIERRETGDAEHYGVYTKLDRPRQIAFQFSVQKNSPEQDPVTFDIIPLNQGCEVMITHEIKAQYENLRDRIEEGWDGILDGLGEALRKK